MKRFLKKWGFPILMGLGLVAWGIVTGNWGMVILSAYLLGSFVLWVQRQVKFSTIIIFVMLPIIGDKIQAIEKWQREAEERVIDQVRVFEAEILDHNTEEQMFQKGQTADGQAIAPPYRPLTIQIKRASGQPTNRVTLKDTGAFHRSFYIVWGKTQFRITANDAKANKLARKYGGEIFGLNDDGLRELIENLREPLSQDFKKALNV